LLIADLSISNVECLITADREIGSDSLEIVIVTQVCWTLSILIIWAAPEILLWVRGFSHLGSWAEELLQAREILTSILYFYKKALKEP
jgi:hypothetical protein